MDKEMGLDRRTFLKAAGVVGGVAALGTAFGPGVKEAEAKTYDDVNDILRPTEEFERYDAANMVFSMGLGIQGAIPLPEPVNEELLSYMKGEKDPRTFEPGEPGFSQLDYALRYGSAAPNALTGSSVTMGGRSYKSTASFIYEDGTVAPISLYGQTSASFPAGGPGCFDVAEERFEFDSPEAATYAVKKAAKLYGADLVGVAPYSDMFVFKTEPCFPKDIYGNPIEEMGNPYEPVEFGFEPKSVIVIAVEMDYEAMKCAPTQVERGATERGYTEMPIVALSLAQFLRKLGYNTRHCGNDVSASVGEAVRAGLGEGSRMSILITEEYGPRVRLCKVYTDLEMAYDKPKTFGVTEFCEVCQVCADSCPSEAITHLSIDDPENKAKSTCSQGGIRKYYLDAQKCNIGWQMSDTDCGICISVCPYNKPKTWNHELVKVVTRIPGLNSFARYFDEFFGYGGIRDSSVIADFWKRTI